MRVEVKILNITKMKGLGEWISTKVKFDKNTE